MTDPEEIAALFEDMRSGDENRLISAAPMLAQFGTSAITGLMETLEDSQPLVRDYSAMALGLIGTDAESAAPALCRATRDSDGGVRYAAIVALGNIGKATSEVIACLNASSSEPDLKNQRAAKEVLDELKGGPLTAPPSDVDAKVAAIFRELVGEKAAKLDGFHHNKATVEAIENALFRSSEGRKLDDRTARDIGFHLADWNSEAAFIVALHLFPERFTPAEIEEGVEGFLIHAPNHVAAAASLFGRPVEDIFGVGSVNSDELGGAPSNTADGD